MRATLAFVFLSYGAVLASAIGGVPLWPVISAIGAVGLWWTWPRE